MLRTTISRLQKSFSKREIEVDSTADTTSDSTGIDTNLSHLVDSFSLCDAYDKSAVREDRQIKRNEMQPDFSGFPSSPHAKRKDKVAVSPRLVTLQTGMFTDLLNSSLKEWKEDELPHSVRQEEKRRRNELREYKDGIQRVKSRELRPGRGRSNGRLESQRSFRRLSLDPKAGQDMASGKNMKQEKRHDRRRRRSNSKRKSGRSAYHGGRSRSPDRKKSELLMLSQIPSPRGRPSRATSRGPSLTDCLRAYEKTREFNSTLHSSATSVISAPAMTADIQWSPPKARGPSLAACQRAQPFAKNGTDIQWSPQSPPSKRGRGEPSLDAIVRAQEILELRSIHGDCGSIYTAPPVMTEISFRSKQSAAFRVRRRHKLMELLDDAILQLKQLDQQGLHDVLEFRSQHNKSSSSLRE